MWSDLVNAVLDAEKEESNTQQPETDLALIAGLDFGRHNSAQHTSKLQFTQL